MASGYFYFYRNLIPIMIFSLKVLKMTSKFNSSFSQNVEIEKFCLLVVSQNENKNFSLFEREAP